MLTGLASTRSARAAVAATVLVAILAASLMSLPPAVFAQAQSNDATLSALAVDSVNIIGFAADRTSYQVGVDSAFFRVFVRATTNHPAARVSYTTDASSFPGHQVMLRLSPGSNPVTVTVTAEDGTTQDYTVSINRGVLDDYGWAAGEDLDGVVTTTANPLAGIVHHLRTFWISSLLSSNVLAYWDDGLRRLPDRDFTASANGDSPYLFTDGQTIWIVDGSDDMIHAYRLSDGIRQDSKDIALHTDNDSPAGIWSDSLTMWVADNTDHRLYAYSLDGGARQESREFDLDASNTDSRGIWSDGKIIWVADNADNKLYAYALQNGGRQAGRDFNTLNAARNESPHDITSNGRIMWVTDPVANKVYAYNMPLLPPANVQAFIGDRQVDITWEDPHRPFITGYQYRVSNDDGVSWDPDWTTIPGSEARTIAFTVRGLANNVEHVIEIRALEGATQSEAARFTATPLGPPSAPLMPENLDTVAGDQTIYLSWHKPVEDPRAPVTSFDARYRPYGSSRSWRNATSVSVEIYDQTIEGLDNRRPYEVQVAAVNRVGRSEWATASAVPQAEYRYGPPSDDGDEELDLGRLNASWTDRLNSYTFHPDQKPLNINVIENSCMARTTFRIFWDVQGKAAKEYEADIQTREGAGEFTYQFGTETVERRTQGYIYGTASLHKSSTLSVRVRARFNPEGWSTWSEPVDLFCFVTDTPATSPQLAEGDNSPATGRPAIAGAARVGETLSATTSDIADPDGLTSATFSYQWNRGDGSTNTDITDATAATYTLQEEDLDYQVSVTVSFTDDEGNDETITSAPVLVLAATPLSGAFDSATLPGEHDGSNTFSFEIYFSEEPVLGFEDVRDHVLDVTNGDVASVRRTTPGSNIRWEITVQPDGNDEVTLLLPLTDNCDDEGAVCTASEKKLLIGAAVFVRGPAASQEQTAANTAATGTPAITGTAQVGETLTADTSDIADEDGLDNAAFTYQWLADDAEIEDATASTYALAAADEGKTIRVKVSFTDDNSNDESLTSAATGAVAAASPTNNEATGAPAISGTVKVGHVLTADITGIADQDGLDDADFDYQWLAEDSPIPAATGSAYLLVAADKGRAITVKVSFTDDGDSDESLTSAATAAVTASPLTVRLENGPVDHDGSDTFTFQLRFSEEFYVSYLTLRDDAFTVDGGEVTNARRLERDSITPNIHWEITVRPAGDGDVTITLPETTDCDAAGAICTEDDRMLSNRLELTVTGPAG